MKSTFIKTLLAVSCVSIFTSTAFAASDPHVEKHSAHWSYTGETSPEHWADLDDAYSLCRSGKEQSPIDISSAEQSTAGTLKFNYIPTVLSVVNNGHTIQANIQQNAGSVTLDSGEYNLIQFHFHTPSEETIDGKHYDMVAHLVHANDNKELAVVAVLFEVGAENPAIKAMFDALPKEEGKTLEGINGFDPASLLPANKDFYSFMGSLTTPPCSEGVHWQVMKTPVTLSQAQLDEFKAIFPHNARPIQPLNDRKVLEITNP